MVTSRVRSLLLVPAVLALLCATALASVATPPSGTPIDFKVGLSFSVKLKNAAGCNFDYTAVLDDPKIASITNATGMGAEKATITLTGLKVGTTMLTIESMNGTCPPAIHTYPVTVLPDTAQMFKDFAGITKAATADVKLGYKLGYSIFKDDLKQLGAEYKLGSIDNDELQDSYHDAADTLRRSVFLSAATAYTHVITDGSALLADNGVTFGYAPIEFFAGGCGSFDTFQNSACSESAKFHDTFAKASKKGAMSFAKLGAPLMGQWCVVPPIYAGGPVLPTQLGSVVPPPPLMGPLTFTTRPTTMGGSTGRLLVSGMADTARSGQFQVTLTRTIDGQLPWTMTQMPTISGNEWTSVFGDLEEGAYSLDTRYTGDTYGVTIPLNIGAKF